MKKKNYKSKIDQRIFKSIRKLSLVVFGVFLVLGVRQVPATSSFFSDSVVVKNNSFTAGYWVPTLKMSVFPDYPNGNNGWYISNPCVKLYSDIDDVTIYYEISGDNPASGTVKEGVCVDIPEGKNSFFAWAVNNKNSSWVSEKVSDEFKIDTQCPFVEITNPENTDEVSDEIEIRGTVIDANPHHYWLVSEDSSGAVVSGPGTVNESNSLTDELLISWNTESFDDGEYVIKLEARDEAGNKCPNQAPVPSDPENPTDSVDWITVEVDNSDDDEEVQQGDVVINEVMWMGSLDDEGSSDGHDEWIELRNMTSNPINLKNWDIDGAVSGGSGHLEIAKNKDALIPANGLYLISNKNKNNSRINVDVDVVKTNISFHNSYDSNGKLVLRDKKGNIIDSTPTPVNGNWPAGEGDSDKRWSMERNDNPDSGWHTCDPTSMTTVDLNIMYDHWDSDARKYNCGTPGSDNLSLNDPSSKDYEDYWSKKDVPGEGNGNEYPGPNKEKKVVPEISPEPVNSGGSGDKNGETDSKKEEGKKDDKNSKPEKSVGDDEPKNDDKKNNNKSETEDGDSGEEKPGEDKPKKETGDGADDGQPTVDSKDNSDKPGKDSEDIKPEPKEPEEQKPNKTEEEPKKTEDDSDEEVKKEDTGKEEEPEEEPDKEPEKESDDKKKEKVASADKPSTTKASDGEGKKKKGDKKDK